MRPLQAISVAIWACSEVVAHGHVANFIVNGDSYQGYKPETINPALLAAWSTSVHQDGFVGYGSSDLPDIVCHINASSGLGYVPIKAGDKIDMQWAGWPEGHHGPVLTYLAYCGGQSNSCLDMNKTELEFFEISRSGLLDPSKPSSSYETASGTWATDMLISNNYTWLVEIPPKLSPGFYVLRHELIALHYATKPGQGPQHYPQCVNLQVTGGGTESPEGVVGTELYKSDEPGLYYDIYRATLPPYPIPGPTMMSGAATSVKQFSSAIFTSISAMPAETGA